jgi:hypothetical protein
MTDFTDYITKKSQSIDKVIGGEKMNPTRDNTNSLKKLAEI